MSFYGMLNTFTNVHQSIAVFLVFEAMYKDMHEDLMKINFGNVTATKEDVLIKKID